MVSMFIQAIVFENMVFPGFRRVGAAANRATLAAFDSDQEIKTCQAMVELAGSCEFNLAVAG